MAEASLAFRARDCKQCGQPFTFEAGPGRSRLHCGDDCRLAHQKSRRLPKSEWRRCRSDRCSNPVRSQRSTICNRCYSAEQKLRAAICLVHRCDKAATRVGLGVCETHYGRLRNTGTFTLAPAVEVLISRGYRICKAPGHPLAMANGWIAEHRKVAFKKYGTDDIECHWCAKPMTWPLAVVDHLNEVKTDNRPANLVVACNKCNLARGGMIPFIRSLSQDRLADLVETFAFMRA